MPGAGVSSQKTEYYRAYRKKGIVQLPFFLLSTFVAAVLLLLLALSFLAVSKEREALKPVSVGIVIPDQDEMTTRVTQILESMDVVKSVCRFSYVDENEAEVALKSGSLDGAIIFENDLYARLTGGEAVTIRVRTSDNSVLGTALFRDMVESGYRLLNTGESGIYAIADIASTHPMKRSVASVQYDFSYDFAMDLLRRGRLTSTSTVTAYGEVSRESYTALSALLILLLLFGMGYCELYTEKMLAIDHLLAVKNITPATAACARLAPMTASLSLFSTLLLIVFYALKLGPDLTPSLILAALIVSCAVAVYQSFLFALFPGRQAPFAYLVITLAMCVLSGGILPSAYLSAPFRRIGNILPYRYWLECLTRASQGELIGRTLFIVICLSFVMLALSIFLSMRIGENAERGRSAPRLLPVGLAILFVVFGTLTVSGLTLPSASVTSIGVVNESGDIGDSLINEMAQNSDPYTYVELPSREALSEQVRSGKLDSGLVILSSIGDVMADGEFAEGLELITSPSSSKALLIRERATSLVASRVCEARLRALASDGETFAEESPALAGELTALYRRHLKQGTDIRIEFSSVRPEKSAAEDASHILASHASPLVKAASALLILFVALLFARYRFTAEYAGLATALRPAKLHGVLLLRILAPTLIAAACPALFLRSPVPLCAALFASVFATFYPLLFKRESTYLSSLIHVLIAASLLLMNTATLRWF